MVQKIVWSETPFYLVEVKIKTAIWIESLIKPAEMDRDNKGLGEIVEVSITKQIMMGEGE